MAHVVGIDMIEEGPREFRNIKIRVVFDNDRYQEVTVSSTRSPVAVSDALLLLARNIRDDPNLFG